MKFKATLAILSILFFQLNSRANDNILIESFNGISGLLQTRCISQDSDGKIWFGTDKQLYSFDGYEIEKLSDEGNLIINCIHIDGDRILFGSNKGLHIYDAIEGIVFNTNVINNTKVEAIVECNGQIYVGTDDGAYIILENEGLSYNANCFYTGPVYSMVSDGDFLLLGSADGIKSYSIIDKKVEMLLPHSTNITSCIYPEEENIWIGVPGYLVRFSRSDKSIEYIHMTMPKCIHKDKEGRILIGTDRGLHRYDPVSKEIKIIHKSIVWNFYTDKDMNLWMASDNGLLMMRQESVFENILSDLAIEDGVYDKIHIDSKGRLWLGGLSGLVLMENYDEDVASLRRYNSETLSSFIPHDKIRNIRENPSTGEVFLATDAGCQVYTESSGRFRAKLRVDRHRTFYYDILADGDTFWMGTFSGLYRINQQNEILESYTLNEGLSDNDIPYISKDWQGNIWILTRDQKIHILSVDQKKIIRKDFDNISKPFASCMISDDDGNIWIGISNKVIKGYGTEDSDIKTISLNASESVETYSMTDIGESIIACTSEGIFLIKKNDMSIQNLNTHKVYVCAAYDKEKNKILFSGPEGVDAISKDDLSGLYSKNAGRTAITRIIVNGSYEIPYIERKQMNLKLPHNQNNIRIYISDFKYSGATSPKFSYSLTGNRTNWQETVSSNSIMLHDMKPGNYTLHISAAEDMRTNATELKIKIRQPWYSSTPMIIFYILLIMMIILLINHVFSMKQNLALQKQQQDSIIEQSKYKEDFFISVAHEFKTPLSLIIAPLSKLIREASNQNDLYTLQLAQDNAIKLNALIHKTLDYYNEDKGVVNSLIATEVEFVEFARSIFSSYKENYKEHEFIFSSSQPEIMCYLDIVKMETTINNLLSNACKYTPDGGSIIMSLEKLHNSDEIIIKVSDTGIGIPEEELPFVFQRYFESSRSKNGNYDSTGVGLSIIKRYVEMHKGNVTVDSDNIGTTFTLMIPCLSENASILKSSKSAAPADNNKPLVVIVDDNIQICKFIESVLSDKYRCVSSHNGKSGLKLCNDLMPDLIISDVMMPVMDGLEMCQKIREIAPLSSIPIILLTAKGDSATEKASISLNIEAFIAKPFDISTLTGRVDQLVGNKRRMEQSLRYEMISNPQKTDELSQDEKYFKKVTQLIEENLDDTDFNVSKLCSLGDFNEKQLYRKLKQFTGMSVVEYIRSIRLKKAAILLQNGKFTVSEVMYTVGFSNASYFSRAFQAAYGKTPSEYMKYYKNQT